ncbi:hypothetical protein B0J13DRAFT_598543 [Dactylonectria estremocensis]|uniref:F-box domain-containing protein n=1 Tax=Dactylonectria estremocensis TaxID=1079267 RepID=A0A9P9ISN4_9HYPO|nr:hypothetical protein B0J13DRAFT_598543 [Dactylonectria estremocensis]
MDKLPFTLVSLIVSCLLEDEERDRKPWLKPPSIAQYASISRAWQDAVEMNTFFAVKVRSNDFSRFETAFRHTQRRRHVSVITYDIMLPEYSPARCWKLERPHEHEENMAVFSRAVHTIFHTLYVWQVEENGSKGSVSGRIDLAMSVESLLDSRALQRRGIGLYRMGGHFLDFTEPRFLLPEVGIVSSLSIRGILRPLHPNAAFRILAALPSLEFVRIDMLEPDPRWEVLRREHYCALTRHISLMGSADFSSLRSLHLSWDSCEPRNHCFTPSDIRDPGQRSRDPLSVALHLISQSLPITEFSLYGPFIISPELYWPNDSPSPDPLPHWPTLQTFTVSASIIAADGTYYYKGTPESESESDDGYPWPPASPTAEPDVDAAGYASDDSRVRDPFNRNEVARSNGASPFNGWRRELDPERFGPLVLALSRAACCMPELRELEFFMGMSDAQGPSGIVLHGEVEWEATPVAGGIRQIEYVKRRHWKAKIGSKANWEPPEEVVDLWRRFVGPGGVITINKRGGDLEDESEGFEEIVDGVEPAHNPR